MGSEQSVPASQRTDAPAEDRIGRAFLDRDMRFVEVDQAMAAMHGIPLEAHLGRTFADVLPSIAPAVTPLLAEVLATGQSIVDVLVRGEIQVTGGKQRSWLMSYYPVRSRSGTTVGVDLEAQIVDRPGAYQLVVDEYSPVPSSVRTTMLDYISDAVIAIDTDERVMYWNAPAERMYGIPTAEAMGQPLSSLYTWRWYDPASEASFWADLAAHGSAWALHVHRTRDGREVLVESTVSRLRDENGDQGLLAVMRDVGEREQRLSSERAARERSDAALALLDTIFTNAPTGLTFVDRDFRYVRINEALATMNGLPAADHIGRTVREILPDLAPVIEPIFERVLSSGEPIADLEIVEQRAGTSGQRIWHASYYPVRVPDGTISGLGIVANDITSQRQAAQALRQSEERFRVALQNARIMVYTTDRDLRYTWIYNPLAESRPQSVLGYRDDEIMAPEEAAKLTAIKQHVLDTGVGTHSEVTITVDGQASIYDLTAEPLRDADGSVVGLTVAALDITDRRATEIALRETEARYAVLAQAVPAILFSSSPDGANDYLSQNYYDYTGIAPEHDQGVGWAAALHPDDDALLMELWQAAMRTGGRYESEFRLRGADGTYRWFRGRSTPLRDTNGQIIRWYGVAIDIDDVKRVEVERVELLAREQAARAAAEQTAERLARLQQVSVALSEALAPAQVAEVVVQHSLNALDAASSTVRLVNNVTNTVDVLASVGVPVTLHTRWKQVPLAAPVPVAETISTGEPFFIESGEELLAAYPQLEEAVNTFGQQAFIVSPLTVEGRTIGALALTFAIPRTFDPEDRSFVLALAGQCAQALERARLFEAAQEAVRVRDSFIAVASHDLRSPLTALLGQAQILERRVQLEEVSERWVRSVATIVRQADRLNRLIEALLDLSRIQLGQLTLAPAPLELFTLLNRIVAEIQPTLRDHILALESDSGVYIIQGDELRLEQVFYNLIGNAVKYSPEGGPVQVRLERCGDQACVAVSDQGIGIPEESQPRLFDRFYRAPNVIGEGAGGLGIGLYVVRDIVERHGGTITVSSKLGQGSTFTVCLPAAAPVRRSNQQ